MEQWTLWPVPLGPTCLMVWMWMERCTAHQPSIRTTAWTAQEGPTAWITPSTRMTVGPESTPNQQRASVRRARRGTTVITWLHRTRTWQTTRGALLGCTAPPAYMHSVKQLIVLSAIIALKVSPYIALSLYEDYCFNPLKMIWLCYNTHFP